MPLLALEGVRVLEVTDGIAGPYCAKLLADSGAEVVKIERPGADSMTQRQWAGQRPDTTLTVEDTALFLHLNTDKKSVALDLESADGQSVFRRLVAESSIVVESLAPGRMESLGIGYDSLKALNPGLVMTSVTPYGQTGPYKDYQYTELTVFATGGGMHREGIPERHPLMYGGEIAQYFAGTAAASATMGASVGALLTGEGDWIDISMMECMAGHPHQIGRRAPFAYNGELDARREPRTSAAGGREPYAVGTFRCKDGHMSFLPLGPRMWPNIARMIGKPELMEDPRFNSPDLRTENRIELEAIFQEWLDRHTRAEVFDATNRAGIPGGPVLTPPDIMADEHFLDRGFFQEIEHPEHGALSYPGVPFGFSDVVETDGSAAPALGEHTVEALQAVGMSESEVFSLRQAGVIS
ncbi:MAG: CoA transferase [SAR202 cluster bacterium]|jgi:crotonobetainyl-CoA:carnitine CoA-transferase CaiB-like acyl-CoA transferase|nr:CoA transferase [SAR202 cluster bacterium]MDP6512992.1 CoA transferase [SAR202 cluster bacterium]MDP6713276.1 CoA transferase [SAR202 cluster bacterium]